MKKFLLVVALLASVVGWAGEPGDDCPSPCPYPCPNLVPTCPEPVCPQPICPDVFVDVSSIPCEETSFVEEPLMPIREQLAEIAYPYRMSLVLAAGPDEVFLGGIWHPKNSSRFSPMVWASYRDLHADDAFCSSSRVPDYGDNKGDDDDDDFPSGSHGHLCSTVAVEQDNEWAAGVGLVIGLGKRR